MENAEKYILVAGSEGLLRKAKKRGYENVVPFGTKLLEQNGLKAIGSRAVVLLFSANDSNRVSIQKCLDNNSIKTFDLMVGEGGEDKIPQKKNVEMVLVNLGLIKEGSK